MNGINWHSGLAWKTFITCFTSSIVIAALTVMKLLFNQVSDASELATMDGINFSTRQQIIQIGISGSAFALASTSAFASASAFALRYGMRMFKG